MLFLRIACLMNAVLTVVGFKVTFDVLSTLYLPYKYTANGPIYALEQDAAEQMAFDATSKLLYSVGHTNIHVIDMANLNSTRVIFNTSFLNVDVTDVELCGGHVFVAFDNQTRREDGFVNVYRLYNRQSGTLDLVHSIKVGVIPDMIHATSDCRTLIVAIEAEPYDDAASGQLVDNPGGVGIVKFPQGPDGTYTFNVLGFEKFNAKYKTELEGRGVMYINRNTDFCNDLEPEYIALNKEETIAYVNLQENNGIAVVDLQSEDILDIYGLGFKDWSMSNIDASDKDGGFNMRPWKVMGMYQPDAIKVYRFKGTDYIITANEGDSKDYTYFSEEVRVKDLHLSDMYESNATARHEIQSNRMLGRLKVSNVHGLNSTTQKYDRLYAFGGRSFSIRRADNMQLVYDSGDEIARKTALLAPKLFNTNFASADTVDHSYDQRSDDKGPETESLAMGHFGHVSLLMIGNERPGTIAVYSIDERLPTISPKFETIIHGVTRTDDTWENLYNARAVSMLDPEDIKFVPADESPNGNPLLLVSGSISGTVTVIQITVQQNDPNIVG
ncbi:mesenchyme-specific cell surface glycoprotein-like [Mya arenaria]|uniref:mesenchyme-specific cell surface glycoprotein-like n=1 Tax=Mya arenaria TaxID=6604 RepID=UPI0022DFCB57|nr:mesenchyme-specific cell surface glycoprotein-like [Mya arenaria]